MHSSSPPRGPSPSPSPPAGGTFGELRAGDLATSRLVRRTLQQWPLVLGCAVLAAVAAFALASQQPKQYRSTAILQLSEVDLGSLLLSENLQQQGQDAEKKSATSAELIMLPRVREAASRALGGAVTPAQLEDSVEVTSDPSTTLVRIHAIDPDPRRAADIADAMLRAFVEIRRQTSVAPLRAARAALSKRLAALSEASRDGRVGTGLRNRIQDLDQLSAATNGGIEPAQTARISNDPVLPNPLRSAILAGFGGGLFGLLLALLRARTDGQVRDLDELTEIWDLPILGRIPDAPELSEAGRTLIPGAVSESFALARTNLRYLHVGTDVKSIVVTSAISGEGKSTVATNLAVAAALAGSRVLLIDADLRRPVLADRLGAVSPYGLSEVLATITPPQNAIVGVPIAVASGTALRTEISVLGAGLVPPNPISLLEREATKSILDGLRDEYDLIVIDTPPATVVADAKVMLEHADGVLVVSRLNHVSREALVRLRDSMSSTRTPVLGWIVNSSISSQANSYEPYHASAATNAPDASDHRVPAKRAAFR